MTEPIFSSSKKKVQRAIHHLSTLEQSIADCLKTDWFKPSMSQIPGGYHVKIDQIVEPENFSEIVGDTIHNLRAALDLMAVEIVGMNDPNVSDVYFPFCKDANDLPSMISRRGFDRAEQKYVDELLKLKPYQGGNVALRALHDLDIRDKHRTLIPEKTMITTPGIGLALASDGTPKMRSDGTPELMFNPDDTAEVRYIFPDDYPLSGQPIVPTLHNLVETVSAIIDRFEQIS